MKKKEKVEGHVKGRATQQKEGKGMRGGKKR